METQRKEMDFSMEKVVWGLVRMLAAGVFLFGLGLAGVGVSDVWEVFTTDTPYYSAMERVVYGVSVAGSVLICTTLALAAAVALWNAKRIVASF